MHLTRESEYALLALAFLAEAGEGATVSAGEMAGAQGLPLQFLSKILQKLARAGIVAGGRGRGRGYQLARRASDISMDEILTAVEPPTNMETCILWQGYCGDSNPCPLHHKLKPAHRQIRRLLTKVSLAEYVRDGRHRSVRESGRS